MPDKIARAVIVTGAAMGIVAMLLHWTDSTTYWKVYRYWDIATVVLAAIAIVAALAAITPAIARIAAGVAGLQGGVFLANAFTAFDQIRQNDSGTKVGLWLSVAGAVLLLTGAITLTSTPSLSALASAAPAAAGWQAAGPATSVQRPAPAAPAVPPLQSSGTAAAQSPLGSTQPASTPPPPGWYPDPSGDATDRRWDGVQWTAETR